MPLAELPGFEEAVRANARRPSALSFGAGASAFGERVRSLAAGWTAPSVPAVPDGWFRSRSAAAPRESGLLPPIALESGESSASSDEEQKIRRMETSHKDGYGDEDEELPEQTIRVIQSGNIILEQNVHPSSWYEDLPTRRVSTQRRAAADTKIVEERRSSDSSDEAWHVQALPYEPPASKDRRAQAWIASPRSPQSSTASAFDTASVPPSVGGHQVADDSRAGAALSVPSSVAPSRAPSSLSFASLLAPSHASSALADVGASLRWSQKFPEGAHMSRARSSRLSMPVLAPSASTQGGRRGSMWSFGEKEKDAGTTIPTLSYDAASEDEDDWGHKPHSRRKSRTSLAETRNGLRFLALKREEVEIEDDASFVSTLRPEKEGVGQPLCQETERKARWNTFKWVLFISVIVVSEGAHSWANSWLTWRALAAVHLWHHRPHLLVVDMVALVGARRRLCCRGHRHPDLCVCLSAQRVTLTDPALPVLTLASFLCLLTAVVGLCGTILNSRPILSLYAFLLWPTLVSLLVVGYSSYKRENLRLDRKLNMAWSRYFDDLDRLRIQNNVSVAASLPGMLLTVSLLSCTAVASTRRYVSCSPSMALRTSADLGAPDQATFSRTCYPRTSLPGCKGKLFRYERLALRRLYSAIFSVVFLHLGCIAASLLCSNHVNSTFGKGLTPRAYRLDMTHVRRNAISIMGALTAADAARSAASLAPPAGGQGGEKSFASIDLQRPEQPAATPRSAFHPRNIMARTTLAAASLFDRPALPPKSPARQTYAFTAPSNAFAGASMQEHSIRPVRSDARREAHDDVRGLGFDVDLGRREAGEMDAQRLGRPMR
jgi:hypothetical protein